MADTYDFSGYATKNDLRCVDGRTIRRNAFKDCDGITVPLVWQHSHGKPSDVLGHALLENREDGVYTYGSFNDTDSGKNAKELVRHGDVKALSIYANQLVQKGGDVLHGVIREVSLCLAGANPGAVIEDLSVAHSDSDDDETFELEAQIYNGNNIELYHSDDMTDGDEVSVMNDENDVMEVLATLNPDQAEAVSYVLQHSADSADDSSEDIGYIRRIFKTLNDEQREAVYFVIGKALEHSGMDEEYAEYEDYDEGSADSYEDQSYDQESDEDYADYSNEEPYYEEDDDTMMQHGYDQGYGDNTAELMHDAMNSIIGDGQRYGSLRESLKQHVEDDAYLAHALDTTGMITPDLSNSDYATQYGYGINGISMLYPDARPVTPIPEFIKRDTDWVKIVWDEVHRVPFGRIKSWAANITEDEARAKGYIKGNMKKEEFFNIIKRTTVPQTVYKKQKMDRDDITDITDFDVVRWLRSEMRILWDEETARAMLIGDGRASSEDDKISEEHIRPIAKDDPTFSIQKVVTRGVSDEATAKNFMKAALRARKDYKGSGNPTLFTTEDILTSMLLIEDGIGHYIYKSEAELATALRVKNIVTVPVMEGYKLDNGNELMGIIVNLKDYTVGTDKGGEITMFDDFDIDYNQQKFLIESRCSGALTKPYSAIVLSVPAADSTDGNE